MKKVTMSPSSFDHYAMQLLDSSVFFDCINRKTSYVKINVSQLIKSQSGILLKQNGNMVEKVRFSLCCTLKFTHNVVFADGSFTTECYSILQFYDRML